VRSTLALITFCLASHAWAGPVEEVAEIATPRMKALAEGNVDAWTAAYADNAVLQAFSSPLRLEGKEAIKAYFANFFQVLPKRKLLARGSLVRSYGNDLVIQDGHGDYYLTNPQGVVTYVPLRWSVVWSKAGGQWQIVEQHVSRLPSLE